MIRPIQAQLPPLLQVLLEHLRPIRSCRQLRIPVERDRAFRFNVTEDSEFA